MTEARRAYWLANGTTALYVALKAAGREGGRVAVQPNVCPNVIGAILCSGNRPLFVDIERARLGMDPARLREVLDSVDAVVAVHSFGIPCLIDQLADLARQHRVPLIEDCAQAEGARYLGQEVGSFGVAAVFSYGAGKIVDAGGGGRILMNDAALADPVAAAITDLPESHDSGAAGELSVSFKRLYNEHYPDRLADHRGAFTDQLRSCAVRLLGRAGADTATRCKRAMKGLQANIEARRSKARLYGSLFESVSAVAPLPLPEDAVPWRYNIRMDPVHRSRVFRALLQKGISASTWYPNIAHFLAANSYEAMPTPNADWLDQGVINLWLDAATDESTVRRTAAQFAELADVR